MTKNTNIVLALAVVAISIGAIQYLDINPHQFFGADASYHDVDDGELAFSVLTTYLLNRTRD